MISDLTVFWDVKPLMNGDEIIEEVENRGPVIEKKTEDRLSMNG